MKKSNHKKVCIEILCGTKAAAVDSGRRERYNLNTVEKNLHPDEEVPL
jgi:hypothetical protein